MPRLRMRLCCKILAHIWNFRFALDGCRGSVRLGKNIVASAVTAINRLVSGGTIRALSVLGRMPFGVIGLINVVN
jgi:hypothetical protein